jgi:uracil-DNA glycosylase
MIIGDYPTREDKLFGTLFNGASGRELIRMCADAGIDFTSTYRTSVFHCLGDSFSFEGYCGPKARAYPNLPAIAIGKYIRGEFADQILRLQKEIEEVKPNIIIALGNIPLAVLTGFAGIGKLRGVVQPSLLGHKILPTYPPSSVNKNWLYRVIVVTDLKKALAESQYPEIRLPSRRILRQPTLQELHQYYEEQIAPATEIAVDIETRAKQITMIGFAPSETSACVIPLVNLKAPGFHYWKTEAEEIEVLKLIRKILDHPAEKVLHNGSYDLQYIWPWFRQAMRNWTIDTTLAHHALYPEMQKDLGFLGSIYTNEASWKILRKRSSDVVDKKEE